jgi:hypothetical protein
MLDSHVMRLFMSCEGDCRTIQHSGVSSLLCGKVELIQHLGLFDPNNHYTLTPADGSPLNETKKRPSSTRGFVHAFFKGLLR